MLFRVLHRIPLLNSFLSKLKTRSQVQPLRSWITCWLFCWWFLWLGAVTKVRNVFEDRFFWLNCLIWFVLFLFLRIIGINSRKPTTLMFWFERMNVFWSLFQLMGYSRITRFWRIEVCLYLCEGIKDFNGRGQRWLILHLIIINR